MAHLRTLDRRRDEEWASCIAERRAVAPRRGETGASLSLQPAFWIASIAGALLAPLAGQVLGFFLGWLP
jgi:hypothetical protein